MLTVGEARPSDRGDAVRVSVSVAVGGTTHAIDYVLPRGPLPDAHDPFLPLTLFPAMKLGEGLRLAGPVAPELLRSVSRIQAIVHRWHPEWTRVEVRAPERERLNGYRPGEVGCFFSAGVDSIYTALKHRDEITTLIFVHGFDVPLDAPALRETVMRGVRALADELGKPLIEVETNLRVLQTGLLDWDREYVGSGLASIALLLASRFRRIYVAAGNSLWDLPPRGSHLHVDPLWGAGNLEIVHDGCEATRFTKLQALVESGISLEWLRVCWENRGGAYNCGRCEKCLRTMASLRALGALDGVSFEHSLDLEALAQVGPLKEGMRDAIEDTLWFVDRSGNDADLRWSLRHMLAEQPAA